MAVSRIGSRRDLSEGRRPLRRVRHRAEAARTRQVEMVCAYDGRTCRHVRLGMQSHPCQIQSGARAVSPAVRQCLTASRAAAGAVRSCSAGCSSVQEHGNVRALGALNVRCPGGRPRGAPNVANASIYRSSRNPLKNGCLSFPSADFARYSISASSFGSTQMPLWAIRLA
jgi:hypothetical protein